MLKRRKPSAILFCPSVLLSGQDGFKHQHNPDAILADGAVACQCGQHRHVVHVQLLAVRLQDPHRGHVQAARRFHPFGYHDCQQQHRAKQLGGHHSSGNATIKSYWPTTNSGNDNLASDLGRRTVTDCCNRSNPDCRSKTQMPQVRISSTVQESAHSAQEEISWKKLHSPSTSIPTSNYYKSQQRNIKF